MNNFNISDSVESKRARWPAILSWSVIILLVAFVAYRNSHANQSNDDSAITVDDIRIRFMGQELIGLKSVASLAGTMPSAQLKESQDRMILQMDQTARSAQDKLHIAIIAGEVFGKDQALSRIETLAVHATTSELTDDISALRTIYLSGPTTLDPASQKKLIQRHDYFAHVALAFGVSAGVEPRKSIESGAMRAVIMLGFISLVFLLLLLGAIGFFIAAIVLKSKGRIRKMYVPSPAANTAYLEGFAIYFVLFILGFGLIRRYFGLASLQWEWLAWLIIPVVLYWVHRRGATMEEQRMALGWHAGKGVFREIGAGFAGYLAGIVVMAVGFALTYLLIRHSGVSPEHPLIHMLEGDRWHILGLYLLVSVFAPVIEETMFRGALFHHLRRRWRWAISAPVVAFIFAIIHPQGWVAVPALGAIAIVLSALREWRGSLIAPMVAHAFNNFIVLTVALAVLR